MEGLISALQYTLPAVVVFFTSWYILREFFNRENEKRKSEMLQEKQKLSFPVRLQAYERIVLFLERISPGNLIMRVSKPGMTVKQLQQQLIKTIRDEYDHNLSQQLYVSPSSWEKVKNAKEELIQQINTSAGSLDQQASSTELSRLVLEKSVSKLSTRKALDHIKSEAREFL
jgi:hypothetical protein